MPPRGTGHALAGGMPFEKSVHATLEALLRMGMQTSREATFTTYKHRIILNLYADLLVLKYRFHYTIVIISHF